MDHFNIEEERSYATPFASQSLVFLLFKLLTSLQVQKHSPDTTTTIQQEYDYIVVGAGSGGSTVAARLSEKSCVNILLLEAGKSPPLLTEVPYLARSFFGSDIDWNYYTTPQKYTGNIMLNRQTTFPSGKTLGGSSVRNGMVYVRGASQIYDQWEAQGARGWSYKDVLPYFKKAENNRNPESVDIPYHGFKGPLSVEKPVFENAYRSAIRAAIYELGYKLSDTNGRDSMGFYDFQMTIQNGQRCSTAKAYLVPAERRKNLDIVKNAFVTKILIENKRAVGVQFDYNGETREIRATREVIVSAGAVNTAKLLMLSGIGPKSHLQEMGIHVIADLPVGKNFHDHVGTFHNFYTDLLRPISEVIIDPETIMTYTENRTGVLTSNAGITYIKFGTYKSYSSPEVLPDYEIYFATESIPGRRTSFNMIPEVFEQWYGPYVNKSQLTCAVHQLRPQSRGTVKLQSADPYDRPLIDPNYLSNPEDVKAIVEALKECDRVTSTHAVRSLGFRPYETLIPGCEEYAGNLNAYYGCHVRSFIVTFSHPVGTAKMGDPNDPTTVVTPKLRVKGIKSLRVVDASVMPIIPAGNTNNPTIMIAEKAADIIKNEINCRNYNGDYHRKPINNKNWWDRSIMKTKWSSV